VRHNLSSNRAFKKAERGPDEKGKGALWTLDPLYEHSFEEAERKQALAALGGVGTKEGKSISKKGKAPPLEPPFKRSIKGDSKGTPLPPPLTSVPLVPKSAVKTVAVTSVSAPFVKLEHSPSDGIPPQNVASSSTTQTSSPAPSTTPQLETSLALAAPSAFPTIPASVRLPIVIGSVPSVASSSSPDAAASPPKPISLHENSLYLNPEIFSHLTPKHLQDLEMLGAQKALEILQSYIVRYYKEKLKAEGSRGRGRGRSRRGRSSATSASRGGAPGTGRGGSTSDLFTTAPLPPRSSQLAPQPAEVRPPSSATIPPMASLQPAEDLGDEPLIVVDDDSPDESPPMKRQRTDPPLVE